MAKRYRVTYKDGKDGRPTYVTLIAKDADEARMLAERSQARRYDRFPLTFERLEQAKDSGAAGGLAIDPRFGGAGLTEAWVKAETEKRKRDMARYDDPNWKIVKVEEWV